MGDYSDLPLGLSHWCGSESSNIVQKRRYAILGHGDDPSSDHTTGHYTSHKRWRHIDHQATSDLPSSNLGECIHPKRWHESQRLLEKKPVLLISSNWKHPRTANNANVQGAFTVTYCFLGLETAAFEAAAGLTRVRERAQEVRLFCALGREVVPRVAEAARPT